MTIVVSNILLTTNLLLTSELDKHLGALGLNLYTGVCENSFWLNFLEVGPLHFCLRIISHSGVFIFRHIRTTTVIFSAGRVSFKCGRKGATAPLGYFVPPPPPYP